MHLLINHPKLKNLFLKKFEIMNEEERKEMVEKASKWCSGCLEFIIETLTLVAVLKILFFM